MYVNINLSDAQFQFETIDRTNLRAEIEKYYVGKTESNIGLGMGFCLRNGRLYQRRPIYRTDILIITAWLEYEYFLHNFFVEPTGKIDYQSAKLSGEEKLIVENALQQWILQNQDWWNTQVAWANKREMITASINGLTPEDAVAWLRNQRL